MKIVIAPDSFKESMTSLEAVESISNGILAVLPATDTVKIPMADGGEGSVVSVLSRTGGSVEKVWVHDPLMRKIQSFFGILPDGKTAIIEMAAASGMEHLKPEERDPLKTTSFGTGELIKAALDKHCSAIIVGLGGSATNDGGSGMMQALGVQFLDKGGTPLPPLYGGKLNQIFGIDIHKADSRIRSTIFTSATDVNNPLLGTNGATHTFALQKGASQRSIITLEKNMTWYAQLLNKESVKEIQDMPGSGAAGGLGAAMIGFLGATIKPGFEIVAGLTALEKEMKTADLVITGEGKLDVQSKYGKTPWGVAQMAKRHGIPVVVFAGMVSKEAEKMYRNEFKAMVQISKPGMEATEAIRNGKFLLVKAVKEYFSKI